jgi:hypothetical protein
LISLKLGEMNGVLGYMQKNERDQERKQRKNIYKEEEEKTNKLLIE